MYGMLIPHSKVLFLTKLREVVLRYDLVSAPNEHFLIHALMENLKTILPPHEHPPPLNTFNVRGMDAKNLSNALVEQLSFRPNNPTSMRLKYHAHLTDYTLQVLGDSGRSISLSLLVVAFERLWREFSCVSESPDRDFVEHAISFATLVIQDIV